MPSFIFDIGSETVYAGGSPYFDESTGTYMDGYSPSIPDTDTVYAGGSPYFDERSGTYRDGYVAPSKPNASEEYQSRLPPDVSYSGGGYYISPHHVENSKVTAMAYALAGVPNTGARLDSGGQAKVAEAAGSVLQMIQDRMNRGEGYESALNTLYMDLGAPPTLPVRIADLGAEDDGARGGDYIGGSPATWPPQYRDGYCPV